MAEAASLRDAVAQLQALRPRLGDAAVDAAIAALSASPPATPAAAERRLRQASVLFVHLHDQETLLALLGTEDTNALVSRALAAFAGVVRAHGGDVLRTTGDGLKAAFGGHAVRGDEAERAVRAGLAVLAACDTLRAEQPALGLRLGIHSGEVLLGGGIEAERSAMGHTVNLAARMAQTAPVGGLRIGNTTWAMVRDRVAADEQPLLVVKGHSEPLRTWLVRRNTAEPPPVGRRGGLEAAMVGRDAELRTLVAWLAPYPQGVDGADSPASRQALVIGEAGVGKTRLRREWLRALGLTGPGADASASRGAVHLASAEPASLLQPCGLLRRWLAGWLRIPGDLPAPAARQQLVAGLSPWLGGAAGLAEAEAARIGQLIGLDFGSHPAVAGLGAATLRAQAFESLRQVLHALARQQPLWLVFDDLHWADDLSLAFVQTLLEPAPLALNVLLLARPELLDRPAAPRLPAGAPCLHLGALDAAAGRALVDALLAPLEGAPAALHEPLLERAGGNPFFIEALVQMLIDDGTIDTRQRPWRWTREPQQPLHTLPMPPTLVGVLQARLDSLPAVERLVLQQASIVGPVFWDSALLALGDDRSATRQALHALQQRGLVVARADSAFADSAEFAFSHQLLHEATYATVLKTPRREGHARAARWLAERVQDRAAEFLALTAEHFERAGDSAQALEHWDQAQKDAFRRIADSQARHCIERALAQPALVDPRWRFMLMSNRCALLDRSGPAEAAEQARADLAAFAEAQGDDAMRADVLAHRMLQADHDGQPQRARELAHEALACARRAPAGLGAPSAALAHGELAWLAIQQQRYDDVEAEVAAGIEQARLAAQLPRRQGGYAGYERQLRSIALAALLAQERYALALQAACDAEAAMGSDARTYDRCSVAVRRYRALKNLGRLDEAAACADELRALAERAGIDRLRIPSRVAQAEIALLRGGGESAAVDEALHAALALAARTDAGAHLPGVHEMVGNAARSRGDRAGARSAWARAVDGHRAQGREDLAHPIACELALLDAEEGHVAGARAAVDAALHWAAGDPRPHHRRLPPAALQACRRALQALGDAEAAAALQASLRERLAEQLQALPDDAARALLRTHVPAWRGTAEAG